MSDTVVESETPGAIDATPYQKVEGEFRLAPQADSSCKFGAGGLTSTAVDLARFGIALTEGRLLSPDWLAAMMKGQPTMPGRPAYGLGVVIEDDEVLGKLASHSGGALGGRSFLLAAPDRRVVVALAANFEGPPLRDASVEIARAFAQSR
jgi:CubicO group peptidase (beta-lactamase class C family)